jgi:integrase
VAPKNSPHGLKLTPQGRVELTPRVVAQLTPHNMVYEIADSRVVGLRIVVTPRAFKSWACRYVFKSRTRKLTIGPYPRVTLKSARKLASSALLKVHSGTDPAAEKVEERRRAKSDTVGKAFADYDKAHLAKRRASTAAETKRIFAKYVLPKWRTRPVISITKADVIELLDGVKAPIMANRIFVAISTFFKWCSQKNLITISPCVGLTKPHEEAKKRSRVLTDLELKYFWRACNRIGFPFGPLFKALLLTGARLNECAGMTWDELNQNARIWSLASKRTKTGESHAIYISDGFENILDGIKPNFDFVFGRDKPPSGFSKAKKILDREMTALMTEEFEQPSAPWRIHDLRRTMRTGLARIGIKDRVAERAVNHILGGVEGTYNVHGYPVAFKAWSAHVAKIVGSDQAPN